MVGSEPASVFEDREISGHLAGEKFDEDGGGELQVFTGPSAWQEAIRYAAQWYGACVEKQLEPSARKVRSFDDCCV